jgi:ribosome biogenesis protein ERB1
MVHQLTRRKSVCPFAKNLGQVQAVQWHPSRPLLYVANQRSIRVYDLLAGALASKLEAGVQWISSLDVHPGGEHVIAGSYDLAPGSSVGPVSGLGGEERLLAAYYAGRLRLLPGCAAPPLACSLCTQGHLPSECPTRLAKAHK